VNNPRLKPEFRIKEADNKDIPVLVSHHRRMFEEIYQNTGTKAEPSAFDQMDQVYSEKLISELPDDGCLAWIVKVNNETIASGAVSVASMVPLPNDPSLRVAFIHSIFTENRFRQQGCARLIMETMIAACRSRGITRLHLNASDNGKNLYRKLGFKASQNSMRLSLVD